MIHFACAAAAAAARSCSKFIMRHLNERKAIDWISMCRNPRHSPQHSRDACKWVRLACSRCWRCQWCARTVRRWGGAFKFDTFTISWCEIGSPRPTTNLYAILEWVVSLPFYARTSFVRSIVFFFSPFSPAVCLFLSYLARRHATEPTVHRVRLWINLYLCHSHLFISRVININKNGFSMHLFGFCCCWTTKSNSWNLILLRARPPSLIGCGILNIHFSVFVNAVIYIHNLLNITSKISMRRSRTHTGPWESRMEERESEIMEIGLFK